MSNSQSKSANIYGVALEVQRRAHSEVFKRMELRHQISRAQLLILGGILAAIALLLERRGTDVRELVRHGITDVSQLILALAVMCSLTILSSVFYILAASYYAHTMHVYAAAYFERKVVFDVLGRLLRESGDVSSTDALALFSWEAVLKRVRKKSGLNDFHAEEQLGFSVPFFLNMCCSLVFVVVAWSLSANGPRLWDQMTEVPMLVTCVLTLFALSAVIRCAYFYDRAVDARSAVAKLRDEDMISDRDYRTANEVLDKMLSANSQSQQGFAGLLKRLVFGREDLAA